MRLTPLRLAFLFCTILCVLGPTTGFTQKGPGGGKGGGKGGPGGGQFDPAAIAKQSFDKMSGGKDVINISDVPTTGFGGNPQENLRVWAQSQNITGGQITRDQYTEYMTARMQQGGGPGGGRGPGGNGPGGNGPGGNGPGGNGPGGRGMGRQQPDYDKAAEDFFRKKANAEGLLPYENMPEELQDEWQKWDADHDGAINLDEYKTWYKARMKKINEEQDTPGDQNPKNRQREDPNDPDLQDNKRPTVYRAGHLPKDMPAWFGQCDLDKDGQVGLYEWKVANGDIRVFMEIDTNSDGFLTVEEVLRWQKVQNAKKKDPAVAAADGEDGEDGDQPKGFIPGAYPNMNIRMPGAGPRGSGGPGGPGAPGGPGGNNPRGGRPGPGGADAGTPNWGGRGGNSAPDDTTGKQNPRGPRGGGGGGK